MDRREVLVGSGAVLSTAVAGCTGSDEPNEDAGENGNGNTSSADNESGPESNTDGNVPEEEPIDETPTDEDGTDGSEQTDPSGNDENWHGYDVEEVKADAEQPDIDDFIRNMEEYNGEPVHFEYAVINQKIEGDGIFQFHLQLSETGQQIDGDAFGWWVGDRFLEGDVVEVWGVGNGPYSYETVQGDYRTVPAIAIVDMELVE